MKRFVQRAAAVAGAAVFGSFALFATASPAAAATYNGACGSGYNVVNQAEVPAGLGTVFLTYSNSSGYNCVVTIRNNPGSVTWMNAGIRIAGDQSTIVEDPGHYTTYAGPVYLHAAGQCVDWAGAISSQAVERNGTNCG